MQWDGGHGQERSQRSAPTHSRPVEMYSSSVYKQTDCLHQMPVEHHLGWSVIPRGSSGPAVPVQEVLWWAAYGEAPALSSSVPGEGWSRSESSLVLEDILGFYFL